jgi:hypothetical protein
MSNEPNSTSTTVSASLGITPNGTIIFDHNGSSGANGQVLVAVGDGTLLWESAGTGGVSQLIAGTGITLSPSNGLGVVTINAEIGVTQLIAGANITLSPTDGLGTVTITANESSTPGGSNTDIQFNNSGAFDGTADLTYIKTGGVIPTLIVGGSSNLGWIQIGSGPGLQLSCFPSSNYSQINDATGTLILATSGNLNLNPEVSLQINGDAGTSGYVLTSQGPSSPPIWAAVGGGGSPGGSNGQLQYNNSGTFAGLTSGTSGQALISQGSGLPPTWTVGPVGTVTSVQLADTSTTPIYGVSGGPITTYGTLNLTLTSQAPNTVFAGPATGGAAQPAFRALVAADLPTLPAGGSPGEIQWNNAGAFDGLPTSTWDGTNLVLAGATEGSGINGGDVTVQGGLNTLGANGGNVHIYSGFGDNYNGYIEISTGGPISPSPGSVVLGAYGSGVLSLTATNTMQVSIGGSAGTTGQVLGSDGAGNVEWVTAGSGSPGGTNGQVQFNNSGVFGGTSNLVYSNYGSNYSPNLQMADSVPGQLTLGSSQNQGTISLGTSDGGFGFYTVGQTVSITGGGNPQTGGWVTGSAFSAYPGGTSWDSGFAGTKIGGSGYQNGGDYFNSTGVAGIGGGARLIGGNGLDSSGTSTSGNIVIQAGNLLTNVIGEYTISGGSGYPLDGTFTDLTSQQYYTFYNTSTTYDEAAAWQITIAGGVVTEVLIGGSNGGFGGGGASVGDVYELVMMDPNYPTTPPASVCTITVTAVYSNASGGRIGFAPGNFNYLGNLLNPATTPPYAFEPNGEFSISGNVGTVGQVLASQGAGAQMQWVNPGSGTPGGPTNSVQFNNSGSLLGDSDFLYTGLGNIQLGYSGDTGSATISTGTQTDSGGVYLDIVTGNAATGSNQAGGSVFISLGAGDGSGPNGNFLVQAFGVYTFIVQPASTTQTEIEFTTVNTGAVVIDCPVQTSNSDGNQLIIRSGFGNGTNQNGGDLQLTSGSGVGTGVAGSLRFGVNNGTIQYQITPTGALSLPSVGYGTTGQALISQGNTTPIWGTPTIEELVGPNGTVDTSGATGGGIELTATDGQGITGWGSITTPNGYVEFAANQTENTFLYIEEQYIELEDQLDSNNITLDSGGITITSGTEASISDGTGSSISLLNDQAVNVNCAGLFSVSSSVGIQPPQWSKTSLPALNTGAVIYVTDATRTSGTGTLAFCDGTNWIDTTTGLPIT